MSDAPPAPPARGHARRRLLYLLPFVPRLDATHGGGRAIAQMLAALAPRHHVALLYLRGAGDPPADDVLRARCELIEAVDAAPDATRAQRWARRARLGASLLRGRPLWVARSTSSAFASRVRVVADAWRPEIVQIEFHVMGQYLSALRECSAPRVLTQYEPGAMAERDRRREQHGTGALLGALRVRAWERYERAIMADVHTVVVFTERDRQSLAPLAPHTPIVRIPLGATIPAQALDAAGRDPASLLFVGNFLHPPNVDAALRLIDGIFPRVRVQFPDATLHIVGDHPPARVRDAARADVHVTGRVPDVTPYLDRAAVVVAPLRLGGGMRVKVLEALAAGKAVVASRLALEGLDLVDGEHVVMAEDEGPFADAIVALLRDPARRAALGTSARAWACANLGWDTSVAAYEQLYDSLIGA